jgi:hypothetical protein
VVERRPRARSDNYDLLAIMVSALGPVRLGVMVGEVLAGKKRPPLLVSMARLARVRQSEEQPQAEDLAELYRAVGAELERAQRAESRTRSPGREWR